MADELTRVYKSENFTIRARPNSCFFCDHLTDIFWDYTNGPYMFICENKKMADGNDEDPIEKGMLGLCEDFAESAI